MLFNSYLFIFGFLPLTLLGFFWAGVVSRAASIFWLLIASLVFYAHWNPAFVLLLLTSVLFNYLGLQEIVWVNFGVEMS